MRSRKFARHALPLALLSFCFVTIRVTVECDPGFETLRFGFPLAWITPALFTSASFVFDPAALAVDLCVYLGAWWLLSRAAWWGILFSRRPRLVSACLWAGATAVVGFCVLILSVFGYVGGVSLGAANGCAEVVRREPHLGLPFQYSP